MKLPRDWKELIDSLCSNRVRFVIVGAHALAIHGRPRATGDLDILVDPTPANAKRLGKAFATFGFPGLAAQAARFARPDRMVTIGHEPLRIDVMTSISGVSFSDAWKHRVRVRVWEIGCRLSRTRRVREKQDGFGAPEGSPGSGAARGRDRQARVELEGENAVLAPGDTLIVPAGKAFSLSNPGAEPFTALAMVPVGGRAAFPGGEPFAPPWLL